MVYLDESRREEAIAAGWLAHADQLPGGEAIYRKYCQGWQVVAVCDDAEVIGALYVREGVIHLGIVPSYRGSWASRRVIRQMLEYGDKTRVLDECPDKISFANRLGFKRQGDTYVLHR